MIDGTVMAEALERAVDVSRAYTEQGADWETAIEEAFGVDATDLLRSSIESAFAQMRSSEPLRAMMAGGRVDPQALATDLATTWLVAFCAGIAAARADMTPDLPPA